MDIFLGFFQILSSTSEKILKTVRYQTVRCVIRGNADLDPVIDEDLYSMFLHSA